MKTSNPFLAVMRCRYHTGMNAGESRLRHFSRRCKMLLSVLVITLSSTMWAASPVIVEGDIITVSGGTVSPDNPDMYVIDMGNYTNGTTYSITLNRPKGSQANYPVSIKYSWQNNDYDRGIWQSCFYADKETGEYLSDGVFEFAAGETTKTITFDANDSAKLPNSQAVVYLFFGQGSRTRAEYPVVKMNFTNPQPVTPTTGSEYPDNSPSVYTSMMFPVGYYMLMYMDGDYFGHFDVLNNTRLRINRQYLNHEANPVNISDRQLAQSQSLLLKPEQPEGAVTNILEFIYKVTEDAIISDYERTQDGDMLPPTPSFTRQADSVMNLQMAKDKTLFGKLGVDDSNYGMGDAMPVIMDDYQYMELPPRFGAITADAKKHLENTLISIKAKNKVVTQNINITKKQGGVTKKIQLTPRGQLHNETIYGSLKQYVTKEEAVNAKFDAAKINMVSKPAYKEALLKRLQEFGNDPKKAFSGANTISKKPIWLDELHTAQVPEKVKTVCFETVYSIRKDISADLKIDKVIDVKIRRILEERLKKYNGNAKQAFSNLDENPIWLNEEKGISIKRVTISGVSNAESLRDKRDKNGNLILDDKGQKQPVDFVNTGNNHHVAIYLVPVLDNNGEILFDEDNQPKYELQENVVSFFEATTRVNQGLPVIDKELRKSEGWKFLFSMKQNEYFVFPKTEKREKVNEETGEITEEEVITFNPKEIDLLNPDNYHLISPNMFRVQKFTTKDYFFRHHLETNVENNNTLKGITWLRTSLNGLKNTVKVRVNHLGQIVSFGEY